jgi:hypothetical protein
MQQRARTAACSFPFIESVKRSDSAPTATYSLTCSQAHSCPSFITRTAAPHCAQVAGKVVSNAEVLWANYPTQATLSFLLTFTLEREKLGVLLKLLPWEWAVVVGVSVAVNWLGNLLQQVTIKRIGAPQVGKLAALAMFRWAPRRLLPGVGPFGRCARAGMLGKKASGSACPARSVAMWRAFYTTRARAMLCRTRQGPPVPMRPRANSVGLTLPTAKMLSPAFG